jgi:hypothetical protein
LDPACDHRARAGGRTTGRPIELNGRRMVDSRRPPAGAWAMRRLRRPQRLARGAGEVLALRCRRANVEAGVPPGGTSRAARQPPCGGPEMRVRPAAVSEAIQERHRSQAGASVLGRGVASASLPSGGGPYVPRRRGCGSGTRPRHAGGAGRLLDGRCRARQPQAAVNPHPPQPRITRPTASTIRCVGGSRMSTLTRMW